MSHAFDEAGAEASDLRTGKGHKDENFPVASFLLKREHRAPILHFYRFARTADDVADSAVASPEDKLEVLEAMRAALAGESNANPEGAELRRCLIERDLLPAAQHGLDLLEAFRRDVTTARYADWDALMEYCRWSAMPVGRFVLDVHGEDRAATWPLNDALCAALQVINHLQDCGKDYREMDRVYLPEAELAAEGARVEDLAAGQATPALRRTIANLATRTQALLDTSRPFAPTIQSQRLAMEVAVIQRLAEDLTQRLKTRDPLSERVHHTGLETARLALSALGGRLGRRR